MPRFGWREVTKWLGFLPWLQQRSDPFDAESWLSYNNERLEGRGTCWAEKRSTGGCRF